MQAVDDFLQRSRRGVAMARDAAHVPALRQLRPQYRAGAESISAVHRQAVVQHMENPCHGAESCRKRFNGPSTLLGYDEVIRRPWHSAPAKAGEQVRRWDWAPAVAGASCR